MDTMETILLFMGWGGGEHSKRHSPDKLILLILISLFWQDHCTLSHCICYYGAKFKDLKFWIPYQDWQATEVCFVMLNIGRSALENFYEWKEKWPKIWIHALTFLKSLILHCILD